MNNHKAMIPDAPDGSKSVFIIWEFVLKTGNHIKQNKNPLTRETEKRPSEPSGNNGYIGFEKPNRPDLAISPVVRIGFQAFPTPQAAAPERSIDVGCCPEDAGTRRGHRKMSDSGVYHPGAECMSAFYADFIRDRLPGTPFLPPGCEDEPGKGCHPVRGHQAGHGTGSRKGRCGWTSGMSSAHAAGTKVGRQARRRAVPPSGRQHL